uniref:Uncharacterized protein n=1 Tax=Anguilla anguilla TaxID=7936 RepID=A0A0E9UDF1_ANGAN
MIITHSTLPTMHFWVFPFRVAVEGFYKLLPAKEIQRELDLRRDYLQSQRCGGW